jgi:hypothetical protein
MGSKSATPKVAGWRYQGMNFTNPSPWKRSERGMSLMRPMRKGMEKRPPNTPMMIFGVRESFSP